MRVTVEYVAQLKRLAGCAAETVEVAQTGLTVAELLEDLGELHGADFRALLLDADNWAQKSLLIFVGDQPIEHPFHCLHDGDRLTILSPMAGG